MHETVASQTDTAKKSLVEQVRTRKLKGPSSTFPKFSNSTACDIIQWYNDVMSIICLREWHGVYDSKRRIILPSTTPENDVISEHLYTYLRLAFQADAVSTIDSYAESIHGYGI